MALDTITSGQDLGQGGGSEQALPPLSSTPPAGQPQAAPQAPVADEPLYEVKADGLVQKVKLDELIRGYQRQSTWTRKTTELANERRQLAEAVAQFRELTRNRDEIRAYYQRTFGEDIGNARATAMAQEQMAPNADPHDLLTRAEAEKLLADAREQLRQQLLGEVSQGLSKVEEERLTGEFRQRIDRHLGGLFQEYPELQRIPGIADDLKNAVRAQVPQGIDETLSLLTEYAQAKAQAIRELTRGAITSSAAAKQTVQRGILPPGGTVAPQAPSADRFRSVKDPRLKETILRDLLSMEE